MVAYVARVYGIVQGVGFRPTVSRHAMKYQVSGSVSNMGPYVEIYVHGKEETVQSFLTEVKDNPPMRAVILKMDVEKAEKRNVEGFHIIESEKREGEIFVSPDIAICPECKRELYDVRNPRYLHPFINCTCCGPRLTILDGMPYDRERTSMKEFPMCDYCEGEYHNPATRRYDAQPVCCNECGPEVYLLEEGKSLEDSIKNREAITAIRRAIMEGKIVAIKGIGGFHLCCDAANQQAVSLLRERKKRPAKPFAVMLKDMETVRRECLVSKEMEEIIEGHQKPILLMNKTGRGRLCEAVAPGNPKVGVMLPYAPVQLLLFDYDDDVEMTDTLVMTSANSSGAPICRDDKDALQELSHLCDMILSHNRLIRLRADDTVMDFYRNQPYMIRRSRGYAPLPFMASKAFQGEVLAVGGELKNTFCIGKNQLFYPSPYIGDMSDLRTVQALEESILRMQELLECQPKLVACDMHPGYNTSMVARNLGLPLIQIQHHYAHVLSCMAENDYDHSVIGVAFDGTGWGEDGSIWGGEILLADYDGYERVATIESFDHVGGDLASKEGWRIAASYLNQLYGEQADSVREQIDLCDAMSLKVINNMAKRGVNSVKSTSMGRVFDAVSAILKIRKASSFEGEASCALEYTARAWQGNLLDLSMERAWQGPESWSQWMKVRKEKKEEMWRMPVNHLIRYVIEAFLHGKDVEEISYYFHASIAAMMTGVCLLLREEYSINTVALSGGVYQNQLLLDLSVQMLEERGFQVLIHHLIPPNDGGICLGQARKAMYELNKR